jgi:hypothetical protein
MVRIVHAPTLSAKRGHPATTTNRLSNAKKTLLPKFGADPCSQSLGRPGPCTIRPSRTRIVHGTPMEANGWIKITASHTRPVYIHLNISLVAFGSAASAILCPFGA